MEQSISSSNPKPVSQHTMPDTDISRQVARLFRVIDDTGGVYNTIKHLSDLPEAFHESSKYLQLVEETLREARAPARKLKSADDANLLETRLDSCEEKAANLYEIFLKIETNSKGKHVASVYSVYRSIAVKLGKHRVETLMVGILEDLEVLGVFRDVMQQQVELLKSAKQELANVPPSLSDSDLNEQPGTAYQYGSGRQYNSFGGSQKNVEGGNYETGGGPMSFGMVPPKETTGGKGP